VAQHFINPEVMVVYGDGFDIDEHGKTIRGRLVERTIIIWFSSGTTFQPGRY